jgi:putative peptide zinc metalloprotease protein
MAKSCVTAVNSGPVGNICPESVPDLSVWTLYKRGASGTPVYILGSPQVDRFILIPGPSIPVVKAAIALFDGTRSIDEIASIIRQQHARKLDVALLYDRLSINGLIARPTPKYVERGDIEAMSLTLMTIDIRPFFRLISRLPKSITPALGVTSLLLIVVGLCVQWFDGSYARSALHLTSRSAGLRMDVTLYYSFLFCSFFFHELAHGLAATYYGMVPRRLCLSLYLGYLPMIYLRIGGTYTLLEQQRIVVWLAGVWWNFTFASVSAILLRIFTFPPGTAHVIAVAIVANYWLGIVNLVPFLPTDGYFVLATLTKSVNVRSNAWRELVRWIKREPGKFNVPTVLFLATTISTSAVMLFRCVRSIHSASDVRLWLTVIPIAILVVRSGWRLFHRPQWSPASSQA